MTRLVAGSRVQVTSCGDKSGAEAVVFDGRFDASTLHLLRERVAACASAAGMPDERAMDVILAVHELAANAVRHGSGAGRLLVRVAVGVLRCQVSDAGPGAGPWPLRQGHGLWIVRAVADEVTASCGPQGSQVTAMFGWRDGPAQGLPQVERPPASRPGWLAHLASTPPTYFSRSFPSRRVARIMATVPNVAR